MEKPYPDDIIISVLKDIFDTDVSKSDLNNPHSTFVCKIYSFFLGDFGLNINKLYEIPMEANESIIENPQFYNVAIYQCRMAKVVSELMKKLNEKITFSLKDIITPDPARTRIFFSKFLNFFEFLTNNIHLVKDVETEVDKKAKDFQTLIENIESYKIETARRENMNMEHQVEINMITDRIGELRQIILERKDSNERLKGRVNGVKEEIITLKMSISECNEKFLQRQQELNLLASQVCFEEELIDYKRMQEDVISHKGINEELNRNITKMKKQKQQIQNDLESLEKLMSGPLFQLEEELEKKLSAEKKTKHTDSQLASLKEEFGSCNERVEELSKALDADKVQIAGMKQSKQATLQAQTKEIALHKETLILLKKTQSQEDEDGKILEKKLKQAQNLIIKEKNNIKKFTQAMEEAFLHFDSKIV